MNLKKKLTMCFSIILLIGAVGFGTKAFAQTGQQNSSAGASAQVPASPQPHFLWDYASQLKLTQTQVGQMQDAFDAFKKSIISLKAKLSLSEIDLQSLLGKNADLKLIQAQVQKSASIEGDMRFAELKMDHTIMSVLTPEQLRSWDRILTQTSPQKESSKNPPPSAKQ